MWSSPTAPPVPPTGHTRRQAVVVVAATVTLACQLPGPGATVDLLIGPRRSDATGGIADVAMLSIAVLVVWLLLAWLLVIAAVAVLGRAPGAVGAAARACLTAIAPTAMRNVLLTVVGASVVTGVAGCAVTTDTGAAITSPARPADSSATADPALPAASSDTAPAAAAWRAPRFVGLATLRIADRIAVEGSAVRSVDGPGAAGTGGTAGTAGAGPAPTLDWPATAVGIGGSATAPGAGASPAAVAPATPAGDAAPAPPAVRADPGRAKSAAPAGVDVDWPGPDARSPSAADHTVVVLRGDSLWAIAARFLPDGADDATVDRTWRAWYAANASVIGDDPDLLLPGQILRPPTSTSRTGTH